MYVQGKVSFALYMFVGCREGVKAQLLRLTGAGEGGLLRLSWGIMFTDLGTVNRRSTHPRAEGDQLEDALKGEAHGEREVHVGEEVREDKGGAVKLGTGQHSVDKGDGRR